MMSDGMHRPPPYSGRTGYNLEHYASMNDADKAEEIARLREHVAECDAELEEAREKIKKLEGRWEKAKAEIVSQRSIEDDKKRRGGLDLAVVIMNEMDEDIKTDKNGYTTWGDNSICGGCKKEGGLTMKHKSQDTTLCVECLESRGLPCPPENPGWPVLGRRW